MIDDIDFFPLDKSKKDKCDSFGKVVSDYKGSLTYERCASIPGVDQFYLTEWDIYTGSSLEFTYCEKCLLKKFPHLKVI